MPKILLYEPVPQAWLNAFADFLSEHQSDELPLELVQPQDDELDSVFDLLPDCDVLLVGLAGQQRAVCRRVFENGRHLKLVQKLGSRAFGIDLAAAAELGVPVSVLPSPAHIACAEHTMLLLLAAVKKLLPANRAITAAETRHTPRATSASQYACNWTGMEGIGLVSGKTLGLVGMGDVAAEVARRAQAFGMSVIYTDDQELPKAEAAALGLSFRELDDLLAEADVVSLHAAHTEDTDKLLDAERLDLMKRTAIVVNTARGGLIDEDALIAKLCKDELAGAALDVWADEPTPKDNPLLALDNVVATPHVAAATLPADALFATVLPNILAALRGEDIECRVEADVQGDTGRNGDPCDEDDEETRLGPEGNGEGGLTEST